MKLRIPTLAFIASLAVTACGSNPDSIDDAAGSEAEAVTDKGATSGRFLGRFSSPSIVRVGDTDHAYFAKQTIRVGSEAKTFHVPHATFKSGSWSLPHEVLPTLGKGTKKDGPVWAPAVAEIAANHWMLYYTAQVDDPGSEKKCIWRAHGARAEGPFFDDFGGPIVCHDDSTWAIDPYLVRDAHGDWNLAARIDLGNGINSIQIRRLKPQAEHFADGSEWHLLARNEQGSWDQHVMENAGVVRLAPPDGKAPHWFVFYSARHWQDNSYAIGYADCGEDIYGLPGGCKKVTTHGPWLDTDANAQLFGPGTPTFYTNEAGQKLMSIQAWRFSGGETGANAAKNRKEGQVMRTYAIDVDNAYRPHIALRRIDL